MRIGTLCAYLFAMEIYPDGEGNTDDDSNTCKQGIASAVAKCRKHLCSEQRECETKQ